jgi:hypothetical protein
VLDDFRELQLLSENGEKLAPNTHFGVSEPGATALILLSLAVESLL